MFVGVFAKVLILIYAHFVTSILATTVAEYRTKEAAQKLIDLYCYRCDSMEDGSNCQDLKDNSSWVRCPNDQRMCKVKSILMSASTEDVTGKPKLWLLQRNCTKTCEPGCIVIGERTKLHSCTTCCENNFCNTGSQASSFRSVVNIWQFFKFLPLILHFSCFTFTL